MDTKDLLLLGAVGAAVWLYMRSSPAQAAPASGPLVTYSAPPASPISPATGNTGPSDASVWAGFAASIGETAGGFLTSLANAGAFNADPDEGPVTVTILEDA